MSTEGYLIIILVFIILILIIIFIIQRFIFDDNGWLIASALILTILIFLYIIYDMFSRYELGELYYQRYNPHVVEYYDINLKNLSGS